jgi:flagellar motor component MotA
MESGPGPTLALITTVFGSAQYWLVTPAGKAWIEANKKEAMTKQAFVKALRGDAEPGEVTPLSYLRTAIVTLEDLETAIAEREEYPEAFDALTRALFCA